MSRLSHSKSAHFTRLAAVAAIFVSQAVAQTDTTIDRKLWQQIYGVTDAQWNGQVPYSDWQNQDDDGDGVKNRDEFLAGTNPFHKLPGDVHFQPPTVSEIPNSLVLTFPTVPGKLYRTESSDTLMDAWQTGALPTVTGDGTPKMLTVPKSAGRFFRLSVTDQSTQGDQVSNWAKFILGLSMDAPVSSQTSYDHVSLAATLQAQNVVTLQAIDNSGTLSASGDTATIRVTRSGALLLGAVTVPLIQTGTATAGTDFAPLPTSITFPTGVSSLDVIVKPLSNPGRTSSATVFLAAAGPDTATAEGNYILGNPAAAGITLYPAAEPTGTGLTAEYYPGGDSPYEKASNFGGLTASYTFTKLTFSTGTATITYSGSPAVSFAPGASRILQFTSGGLSSAYNSALPYTVATVSGTTSFTVPVTGTVPTNTSGSVIIGSFTGPLVRRDPTIDFNWTSLSPDPALPANYFTVRWTGQILPQYSQKYTFIARVDDGVRLWVDGRLIVNRWPGGSVNDSLGSIDLKAGNLYDIRMDYYEATGSAEAHLSWYSEDRPKEIVPSNRLFPTMTGVSPLAGNPPSGAPAITSETNPVFVIGSAPTISIPVITNNGGTLSVSGLAPWMSWANSMVTGTPPGPGTYQFTVTTTNSSGISSAVVTVEVVAAEGRLTREIWTTGVTGNNIADVPWSAAPDSADTITMAEDTTIRANQTGARLRGYFIPPTTGNYYFWIAANNAAELWISNNSEPVNKVRRAYVSGPSGTAPRTWDTQSKQKSRWLSLVGGQKYYIEALHNSGADGANQHLSIAWFADATGTTASALANGCPPAPAVTGGVLPGNAISPWDNPPTIAVPGALYTARLQGLPGLDNITATGGAFLRVSGSAAILQLDQGGLTSGVTSRKIVNSSGQTLFDLGAQDKNYPARRTSDGGYAWDLQASDQAALATGNVELRIATIDHPDGEISGSFGSIDGSQTPPAPPTYAAWPDQHATSDADNSRFLIQATFGPSPADLAAVKSMGYRPWIDSQFNLPPTQMVPYVLANLSNDPQNKYGTTLVYNSWWKNSVTAPDQLRQRTAFALSEILVVSNTGPLNNNGRALADYYDTLLDNSFGNFRDILKHVTLSPAMGVYLDMRANAAGSQITGLHPNENYAREILQLFSAGLYRTWPDGTIALDSNAAAVPTYDQQVITGMARVFTGWNYSQKLNGDRLPTSSSPASNYIDPMVLIPNLHELGNKNLLDNVMLPAFTGQNGGSTDPSSTFEVQTLNPNGNQGSPVTTTIKNIYDLYGLKDLEATLDTIMENSATGPYICRQLIQRFVTSQPTPAYVQRVVLAFNGERNVDGVATGVRGDMKDILRAILLDYEARSPIASADPKFGKQREPLLRVTGPARAFPSATMPGSTYRQLGGQDIMVTTPVPHLLTTETIGLVDPTDAGNSTTNLPTSRAYSVKNVTPSYTLIGSTGIATISSPGYQPGDIVSVQFTSGGLGTQAPYNQPGNYAVQAVTPDAFTINIGSTALGNTSGGTRLPKNFTVDNVGTIKVSYTITENLIKLSISSIDTGDRFYVNFTSGGAAGAGYDGVYTVASSTGSVATISLPSSPSSQVSGSCTIPRYKGGYSVSNSGGVSTIQFQTDYNHNVIVGDNVQIKILQVNTGIPATSGVYAVQSVDGPNSFTVASPTVISSGSQGTLGMVVLPLKGDNWLRSGTVTVDPSTWGVGSQSSVNQTPLNSTTVFNFFSPDYRYPGELSQAGMTVPEFQLTNDSNTMNLTNIITQGTLTNNSGNSNGYISFFSGSAITMNMASYMNPAQTSNAGIPGLVDELSVLLMGRNLQPAARTAIINYVANSTNFPYTTPTSTQMRDRVRAIVNLITTSAEYAIQR